MDTKTTNCKTENDTHYFENDSVKITYTFWALHGNMSFSVFNKTKDPLYVNWKNSSFIVNGEKFDYWSEMQNTTTESVHGGWYNPRYGVFAGTSSGESVTTKPEKVTFIPPRSSTKKVSFYLMPQDHFPLSSNKKLTEVPYSVKPTKLTTVYVDAYSKDNTPVLFRNFVALSGSEDADHFSFIDNEFYVSEVREMSLKHFRGNVLGTENGEVIYEKKEKVPDSFYLYVPKGKDL